MPDHPTAPEQRTIDVDVQDVETRGRTLHGYAAVYGAVSADLGGFRERIAPGAFAGVLAGTPDVRALLNHDPSQVLGRTRSGTLRLADDERGLRFELDLPDSPLGENVRTSVARGDIDGASFRFRVGEESWSGSERTVQSVAELQDVTVATFGAYPAASVELRTRPTTTTEEAIVPAGNPAGGLRVEDRTASPSTPTIETRVLEAFRSVRKGESRSLTNTTAAAVSPVEISAYVWDRLRAASVVLASGVRVIPTDRREITFPRFTTDVVPAWLNELELIPATDPTIGTLTATPKKLAVRTELSNEVLDDSEPSIAELLDAHMIRLLALRLDFALLEGNAGANPKSINGLKFTAGIQTISMGTNGAAMTNLDAFVRALGLLASANVPGPYVILLNPRTWTDLGLVKEAPTGSNVSLLATGEGAEEGTPLRILGHPVYASTQLSTTEGKGTATNASSAYVYSTAPDAGPAVVSRQDAEIELDRSRLFDVDGSEIRGKLRADLIVPNPAAIVRIDGIIPAA